MRWLVSIVALGVALVIAAPAAFAQSAEFSLPGGRPHVEVPFQLDLAVSGFDEQPQPELPKVDIKDATVTPIGAQPSVSRRIQIINGRRSDETVVEWTLSYRVVAHKEGSLVVPSVTVVQGSKKATARAGNTPVEGVATSDDMKLQLAMPDRAVFVGETVPVTIEWLFKREPQGTPQFSIPIMESDAFTVSGPPVADPRKALTFQAGGKELQLPYTITDDGGYKKLSATFFAAPRTVGKVDLAAASVTASLAFGRPDFFGNAPSKLFRAADVPRSFEVKPLPETGRPADFAGAVGDQFSIDVATSRSVVSLGEPVDLEIHVKSNQRLDTLALGKLDGDGRLPKDLFSVPAETPTGELSADGKTKTFKVTVQVTGPAREIPTLSFSYFDPVKTTYQTIKSEPIALSVKGTGNVVGVNDVVGVKKQVAVAPVADDPTSSANVELALSSASAAQDRPLGGAFLWLLVGLLYAIPLALFLARRWQLKTADAREESAASKSARKRVEALLDQAANVPARDIGGSLAAALREAGRALGGADDAGLIGKLETAAFAPDGATKPLSADLRSDAAGLLRKWSAVRRKKPAVAAAVVLAIGALAAPRLAHADPLADGRAQYQEAMQLAGNPTARKAAFTRAAASLGDAAATMPDRPELLADWGNAALGAGNVGVATLAYRRALLLDGSNPRARKNLAWLRGQEPEAFRPAARSGATDALLFFHAWPRARKIIVGAVAFAAGLLLLVPWTARRRGWLRAIAVIPAAVWLAMLASTLFEDRHAADAVVMDESVLRAADSAGAPAAIPAPVPRGAEVTIVERRDAWTKVRLPGDATGWLPATAVERVVQ
ncbi:MAG TPA: BatD family protein [Kofleriaceae bacterium]|jgi:hypothetical protein